MLKTKSEKIASYSIIIWMIINIALLVLMIIGGDEADLNNWIETGFWIIAIAGLLSARKWGTPFAIFTLVYTLSTSMGNVIYTLDLSFVTVLGVNALRVAINAIIIVYLFAKMIKKLNSTFLPNS